MRRSAASDAFGGRPVQASSPQGRFVDGAALLNGHVLRQTEAHGKHFLADFEGAGWLHIHLGLIGKVDFGTAPVPEPVGQVRLRLQNATSYADLRGATVCEVLTDGEREVLIARLGPDPLRDDADPEPAWNVTVARSAAATLMTVFAACVIPFTTKCPLVAAALPSAN